MLADGQQFQVGETVLLAVGDQLGSQGFVAVPTVGVVGILGKAAQMDLVDAHGTVVVFLPLLHPFLIGKGKPAQIADHGSGLRPELGGKAKGVAVVHHGTILAGDFIFIQHSYPGLGQGHGPTALFFPVHLFPLPMVALPDELHKSGTRGINPKPHAVPGGMGAEMGVAVKGLPT